MFRYLRVTILVLNALRNACHQETPSRGTLFHSDRGGQDVRDDVRQALDTLGRVVRMSRQGNGWDHAVTESFFATLKAEDATEPYATKQEAHRAIAESIPGFYNPVRLHSSLRQMNVHCKRFNRTLQESFVNYHEDLLFTDLALFNQKLADWLVFYGVKCDARSLP